MEKHTEIKLKVMTALRITEEQWSNVFIDSGKAYFESKMGAGKPSFSFWKWWKNQYAMTDIVLLRTKMPESLGAYYEAHVSIRFIPSRAIVNQFITAEKLS